MRFSMILEMVDRMSAPAKRAKAGAAGVTKSVQDMGRRVRGTAGDLRRGERSLKDYARAGKRLAGVGLARMFQSASRRAKQLTRDLRSLANRLQLVERAGFATGRGLRKLGGMAVGGLKIAGAAAGAAGGFALFDLFRTAGQFEQYQVMLEGIEGSGQAARKSMDWVKEFSQSTPFQLAEVMEAFVALKAYGIDPTNGSLKNLGDASAGMSKPLMQAVEAMADAMTGEFERLKEFGIRARVEGDKVTFTYRKNGEDIQKTVAATGSAIEGALQSIFSGRFEGAMERQSQTMFGIISNLKDMWSEFLIMIADAGIFEVVKEDLKAILLRVKELAANGELKKWAEDISARLEKAWEWATEFIEKTDWDEVIEDMRNIARAVGLIADGILKIADNWKYVSGILKTVNPLGTLGKALLSQFGGDDAPAAVTNGKPFSDLPGANKGPSQSLPSLLRGLSGNSGVKVSGNTVVEIRTAPGLVATTRSLASNNAAVPLEVRTGKTMRSAA